MIPLPRTPSLNEQQLASFTRERFTGLTGDTITLSRPALAGLEMVYLNGALLDPENAVWGYTISGSTITLVTDAVAADVFVVTYFARVGA